MRILAIETSCDETGLALLEAKGGLRNPRFKLHENLVASQIAVHAPFGGVVPNLAKREHLKNLPLLWERIWNMEFRSKSKSKKIQIPKVDLVAVTVGPGLEPALWTGITFAKKLITDNALAKTKLVGANHLEGHLYSFLLSSKKGIWSKKTSSKSVFPAIALIVSGGHTLLLLVKSFSSWKRIGDTRDDAAGEAFDKVARLLDLPYPGGPEIERLAKKGNPRAIAFPRPMLHAAPNSRYDFSFSGLKTAVLYYLKNNPHASKPDVAASFEEAVLEVLAAKTFRAVEEFGACSIILSGGVAANKALRRRLKRGAEKRNLPFWVPESAYNLDNAAMMGAAGYLAHLRKRAYPLRARGDLKI